jgi:hypothetical protein
LNLNSRLSKCLALLFAFIFLISTFNYIVWAQNEEEDLEPDIIRELIEKRELTVKHFEKEDGTFEAVSYGVPVHYDKEGVLKEIDNRMFETKDDEEKDDVFQTTENDFNVKIAKMSKSEKLIRLEKDKYKLTWGIENTKSDVEGKYKSHDINNEKTKEDIEKLSKNEQKQMIPGLSSEVNFEEIMPDMDLQYVIDSSQIKENIILKKYMEKPEFTFLLNPENMKIKLNEDNSLTFYDEKDEDNIVMVMKTPYMIDQNADSVGEVKIELNELEKGYEYNVIPDDKWLKSKDRKYPVLIDPPIETSKDANKAYDRTVCESRNPDYNENPITVGYGVTYGIHRTYMKFGDIPILTNAFEVKKAYLSMFLFAEDPNLTQIDAYRVTENWESKTITWDNRASFGVKLSSAVVGGEAGGEFTWDITSAAKQWCEGKLNYGVMFRNANETKNYNSFHSTESNVPEKRPIVKIHYAFKDNIKQYLGRVQMESFDTGNGPAIYTDVSADEGHYVGNFASEDKYIELSVYSKRSGFYDAYFRLACDSSNNILKAIVNEGCSDEYVTNINVPDKGSLNWDTVKARLRLRSGENRLKIIAYKGYGWNIDYVYLKHNLPDVIEAESFYDSSELLQVYDTPDKLRYIGDQKVGEYYDYFVDIQNAGQYKMNFTVSSESETGKFKIYGISKDSQKELSGDITVPSTGANNKFETISEEVYLTKDITKIRIKVTGDGWNFDKFDCLNIGPRTIQAEEYIDTDGVDTNLDSEGEQYITSIEEGNYASYNVVLRAAGTYNLGLKVSSERTDGVIRVEDEKGKILARYTIPQTTELWNKDKKWYDINKKINLKEGTNTLKVYSESLNWDLEKLTVSHSVPKIIEAQDITDTNTATIENGVLNLKQSEYVKYNLWVENPGKYTVGLKQQSNIGEMDLDLEDGKNKVIGSINIPENTVTNYVFKEVVELKEGYMSFKVYTKKGQGSFSILSIEEGENLQDDPIIPEDNDPQLEIPLIDRKSMKYAKEEFVMEVVNQKIYTIGGKNPHGKGMLNKVEEYDTKKNIWAEKKDMPESIYGSASAIYENKIYVIGGINKTETTNKLYIYDTVANAWTNGADMPSKRSGQSATISEGKIYVAGGYDGEKFLDTLEVYDISADKWTQKLSYPIEITGLKLNTLENKIYATGGKTADNEVLDSVYEYDVVSDKWTEKSSMNNERWKHSTTVFENKLYVIGGYKDKVLKSVEVYDLQNDSWGKYQGLKYGRYGTNAVNLDESIYVAGGHNFSLGGTLALNEVLTDTLLIDSIVSSNVKFKVTLRGGDELLDHDNVLFAAWSTKDGQDDIIWYDAEKKDDSWVATIDVSKHNYDQGEYEIHVYAKTNEGEQSYLGYTTAIVEDLQDYLRYGNANKTHTTKVFYVDGDYDPVSGDFNGDGKSDIIWYGSGQKNDTSWYGADNRKFTEKSINIDGKYKPLSGDFNGDGKFDILWYGEGIENKDELWFGKSDKTFSEGTVNVKGYYEPFTGDFDGDGRWDVFWYGPGPEKPDSLWFGKSDGTFTVKNINVVGVYKPVTGDFDSDGKWDIIWYAPGTAADTSWYAKSNRTFTTGVEVNIDGYFEPIQGDFNGDGNYDVYWYGPGNDIDRVWYLKDDRSHTTTVVNVDGIYRPTSGDYDGDKRWDVFFYRP